MSHDQIQQGEPDVTSSEWSRFPERLITQVLYRIHSATLGVAWFSSSGKGRFDLEIPRGTCYLATDRPPAVLEVLGGEFRGGLVCEDFFEDRRRRWTNWAPLSRGLIAASNRDRRPASAPLATTGSAGRRRALTRTQSPWTFHFPLSLNPRARTVGPGREALRRSWPNNWLATPYGESEWAGSLRVAHNGEHGYPIRHGPKLGPPP